MKNMPITTDWFKLQQFYSNIAAKLHEQGINSLTTGGIACILYKLAQQTKDCDIIIPEEKADEVVEILAEQKLNNHRCRITLKYGAPLDSRWLRGGWSSHTYFGTPEQPLARLDFFGRPPRVPITAPDEHPHYLSRDGVARMKKTRREKDWTYANLLGMQILEKGDVTGLLHITDTKKLIETCKTADIPFALLDERPILRLAAEGHPEVERYIKAEKEFWTKLDDLRLKTYEDAWKPYGDAVAKESTALLALDMKTQNQHLIDIASDLLERSPLQVVGWRNLVDTAKEQTEVIFKDIDTSLLPTPIPFAVKEDGLGLR